jgi:hypothetical protein
MVVHGQPNGEVVATFVLGSRVLRVVGGRPDRGCAACAELRKAVAWAYWLAAHGNPPPSFRAR